ncbi:4-coumarate--CoA ligase 1-like [Bombyx mandarina]|uniref:4-coumarate--CoA ligase 1-like n=1 Tax=Bombyx mandarina TaxID=7092 RepID=A0A6J2K2Z3_BOMMA|nr:4-coumarate--CoA ligase 1-like [Bombyx mandarina]
MSFNIDDPQYHMGHLFMDCMRRRPDSVCQVDAATGETETNASVLQRSVRLAKYMRTLGLKPGDVLALGGRNHLDLYIPYYAALMNGYPITGVDPLFKLHEIKSFFKLTQPKIAFCQQNQRENYLEAARELGLDTRVITFDGDESMSKLLADFADDDIADFQPATFDLDKVYVWLISTGGTSGALKVAAIKHKAWIRKAISFTLCLLELNDKDDTSPVIALNLSPVQWVSGLFNAMSAPLLNQTKVQTSALLTMEHVVEIINKYKPKTTMMNPSLASNLLAYENCDFKCFKSFVLGGGKLHTDVILALKSRLRHDALLIEGYGQTENIGPVFATNHKTPIGSCGKRSNSVEVKLVDPETGLEITEPHVLGELWTKGDCFTEYYMNPEETAKAFTADGWFKTGDILYRDEEDFFYFVERMSMIIQYRSFRVIPLEIEGVIRTHEGVLDVSVTSIPSEEDGEHPVACVVRRKDATVTAEEIKDHVADKLSDSKRLRGGVIFMDELPMTSVGKVARAKLRQLAQNLPRE